MLLKIRKIVFNSIDIISIIIIIYKDSITMEENKIASFQEVMFALQDKLSDMVLGGTTDSVYITEVSREGGNEFKLVTTTGETITVKVDYKYKL